MKKLIMIFISSIYIASGCASNEDIIDKNNYRDFIKIKKSKISFYLGKYKEGGNVCFPPITRMICHQPTDSKEILYEKTKSLDMEQFRFEASSDGTKEGEKIKELIFLSASDLAIQRGYAFMTQIKSKTYTSCGSSYSTTTTGSYTYDGNFRASTMPSVYTKCSTNSYAEFIFLNDISALKEGVFYQKEDNKASEKIMPYEPLYYGTSKLNFPSGGDYINNAWSEVYNAGSLSKELRKKHGIKHNDSYRFDEESDNKIKNDVIERNKVK